MAADVKEAFRQELIDQNLVRKPSVPGALPPCWVEPRNGVPAPGELAEDGKPSEMGEDLVLGVLHGGGIPQEEFVGRWIRVTLVDVHIRSKRAPDAFTLEGQLRHVIDEKVDWNMGGLQVISTKIFREMQPLKRDAQAFTYVLVFAIEHYLDPAYTPPV